MKYLLVTGASGQLGKRVVNDLLTTNYAITAVSRDAEILNTLWSRKDKKKLNLLPCDLVNENEVSGLLDIVGNVNLLVHLAGGAPADPDNYTICTEQINMSINLIGIFGNQLDHAIIGSCTSVYGTPAGMTVPENHPTLPTTYHGASQLTIEKLWSIFSINSGKPLTCLRFAPLAAGGIDSAGKPALRKHGELNIAEASQAVLIAVRTRGAGILNVYPRIATR
jgi:nucleoside-diphosphate-sugar epimerase